MRYSVSSKREGKEVGKFKRNEQLDKHDDKLHDAKYETYFGTLDPSSTKDGEYNVAVNEIFHVELGLKIHGGAGITKTSYDAATGTASYNVPEGLPTSLAAWNFDFSVNTSIDGSKKTLDDFDFRIVIKSDDGEVGTFNLAHLAPGNTPWVNSADSTTIFGDQDGHNPQISQNSANLSVDFMREIFGSDFNNVGEHYTVQLQAFKGLQLIGVVTDQIHVIDSGSGGAEGQN